MGFTSDIKNIKGIVTVQIEGFFTERFINLCKISNVKIWDIRNVVKGVVRFSINISNFKKLRPIARKTKCKVNIKNKKGLYFTMFKYRKRKLIILLITLLIASSIAFSTFIWKIEVVGNEKIPTDAILQGLKDNGIYVGKSKFGLDKKNIVNGLRIQVQDISWAGVDFYGTTARIQIVEKTNLDDKYIQNKNIGDIVSSKSGIITKIIPENGTSKYTQGSYIEKGNIAIEGKIYSKFVDPIDVTAKGILKIESNYEFRKTYNYEQTIKNYTSKKLFTIGISINSKENMLNYLNKNKKYDITKTSKSFKLFNNNISFDIYECVEYVDNVIVKSKEQLIEDSKLDSNSYLMDDILKNARNASLIDMSTNYVDSETGIEAITTYVVSEEVGEFVGR